MDISALVTAGTTPISYTVTSITTPSGVTLVDNDDYVLSNGELTFYPPSAGEYVFVVTVANGITPNATYTWTVTATNPGADCWICLETSANGTYYVGDSLASGWWVNWQVNGGWDDGWMKTWVGWQTSGDGYTEYTASWYADDGSNKKVHSDIGGYTFKVAQPHYIIAQGQRTASGPAAADATPGTSWTDSSAWPPDGLNTGTAHFTVNAIPVPASMSAATGDAAGKVQLSWTKNTAGHNVMVVRYASGVSPTTPTDGTAYAQGASIGSGTVVYNGSGTSYGNTGLTGGTTYDYYFYSVNNNYYSEGTKKSAAAAQAPTFATATVSKPTTTGTKVSNSQTASGTPSTMTYSATCTAGGATAGNGTTAGTYSINSSSGAFDFTPGAAGAYSFTVTANNGVGSASYTITVTAKPVALTLGAAAGATPGTVTLTVSGRESDATVNVRRYDSSTAADNDTAGTGGTQVTAANANGTFTDSGLDGCKTYYYKAWQTRNSQTSAATDTKSAKTTLATPDVWSTADDGSITLNWPPVKGAVNYTVEIATDDTFAAASGGTATDTLDSGIIPTGTGYQTINYTATSGAVFGGSLYKNAGMQIKKNTEGLWTTTCPSGATIQSITLNMKSGTAKLYAGNSPSLTTSTGTDLGSTSSTLTYTPSVSYTHFMVYADNTTVVLNSIEVVWATGGGSGGTMMAGYPVTVAQAAAGATNVSHSLSGLTNDVTYSYRVTANGAESCTIPSSIGHETPTAVTPVLTVSPLSLSLGSTTYGTAGGAQSFSVSGSDLTAGVTVTPPAGVSVCLTSGGEYQTTPLTISQASATSGATVYVKLTGASVVASLSDNVTVASTGATTVNVSVSGSVTAVVPTVGSPTRESLTTTGATLGGTVSANGGATLTEWGVVYSATSKNTTPTVGGTGCTNLTASGTPSLAAFTRAVSGLSPNTEYKWRAYARNSAGYGYTAVQTFTTLRPTLTVSPSSVSDMAGVQYQDGTPANVSVSGANMMGNVTVAVTSGFEVSTDGGSSWGSEKSITVAGATLSATTVKVRIASGSGTGAVTGTLTVSSSNAADVTVSLSGSVSGATTDTGSWLGNSYLVLNGDWYNGSGADNTALPATLGYLTTLTLGAQVQTYGQNDGETYPAYMTYSIDSGAETTVALVWFRYNDENHNNYFGMGGSGGQHVQTATTLDLSGLSGGEHTLTVYFSQPTSVGSGTLYDDSSSEVDYTVTFVIPAWNGPNAVYWREEAVDGHFTRQDGDGNHDPWWYRITPTVGFHNPNMTDYGPNDVIFNNNVQPLMTNDVASTVASFSHTADVTLGRTNWGAALTVNSAITNLGAPLMFKAPVVLGGNVKVHTASGKWVTFGGGVSGSGKTLTKASSGTLYLTSAVTVDTLAVSGGIVRMNTGSSLSGNMTLASGTTFRTYPKDAGNTVNYAGVISGAGKYQKQGSGTTTLSGANSFSGGAAIWTGTVVADNATALGTGAVTVRTNATLKVGVASVSVASVDFMEAGTTLSTGAGKVLASTGNAAIKKVTFDAGDYSGDDTQWTIVTSSSGTITQAGDLTVVNGPASGRFELELAGDGKTLYVTYHKPPAAPTLTVATVSGNGGALSVTATPPAGAGVVVVRNETGTFGSPTGSTLPSVGATDWAGGTVVDVTGGTFTDSGLTGCTTYYYSAWSLKNGLWSTTGGTGSAETVTVAAPVLNALSSVTYQGFTASWNAVPGAATYRMDIVQGSAETTAASYDFNENTTGWTLASSERDSNALKIGSGSYGGSADSPTINLSGNGGNATLAFDAWSYGSDTDCILDVWYKASSSDTDWVHVTDTISISSSSTPYSFSLTGGTSTSQISFTTDTKKKRVYVDNIVITQGGSSPVAGWTDKDVGSIMTESAGVVSVAVTGLEELTTYSVTVRAEGATAACASADSNTESATTLENDTVTSVAIANYDAAGEAAGSNVADGAVAAGQTVLLQGTKLTVASGSVTPVLTGVAFATTGTATGSDAGTLRVRVGTSSTYAGTETALGTATYTGAGTYTVSGSQSLTPGTTYYVWIEAVTAAGAAGGSTVKVGALTGSSFAITNGRKTGSTTAAGTQTIGNLTAFSAGTGSAAGGQVALTWALGASGTVTVRWSTDSLAAIPAPGEEVGEWTAEATGLTGSTGTTLTMPVGCQAYYFKAWEVVGGVVCGLVRSAGPAAASGPAVPTGLDHGTPGAHNATLTWSAAAGATGYAIDLWHFDGGEASGIDGTYTKITSTDDLAEGNYLIVAVSNSSLVAMKSTTNSTPALLAETVGNDKTATSLTITTNDAEIVWYLAYDGTTETWSFRNDMCNGVEDTRYAASKGNDNKADIVDSVNASARWKMGVSDGMWAVTNMAQTNRTLKYNPSSPRFACYASGQSAVMLFKQSTSAGERVDDVIGGVVQDGSPVRVTAHGATGVDVERLLGTTTYYWDVKATGSGSGCESSASASDHFTTAEQLGAPVIGALTPGVEQLRGRVTGEAGATLILKRYETEAAARAGSATGMDGGVVVAAEETAPGSGIWDFMDTGLDGCTTYAYRAWQVQRIDGEDVTSSGSAVVSEQTQLGTPTVTAVGAGTQMTIRWAALPGAVSYQVQISDTEGVWTAPTSGETVLDEDFAGFTGSDVNVASTNGQTISSTLTHDPDWYGNTVYASNGMARIGKSNAAGLITTPKLSALANGGTLSFKLKKYGTDNNALDVQICYDDGEDEDTWTSLQQFTTTTNWQECEVTLSPNAQDFWICFETTSKRAWLDDVLVVSKASSSTGGLIYDVTVTDPPFERTKIGLEIGQPYYYKVIATGAEGCVTEAGGTASTANAPMIEVTPKHYNFGTVNKTDGPQTATFTIRNTGNIALKFDPATTGAILVQDGEEYSITSPAVEMQRKADLAAGQSRTYTVQFNPLSAGAKPATLRFRTDAYNVTGVVPVAGSETYANLDIPLSAECYDPATADPEVLRLEVTDGLGVTNTVWDESLANSASQPVLSVVAYHYNGIDWNSSAPSRAQWTLYAPDGTAALSGQSFTSMDGVEYDGRACVRLSAPIPALGAAATALGTWSVGVTLKASNLTDSVTTRLCMPPETGVLLDDFTRPDAAATGAGTLGNGWSAEATDEAPGSAVIHGHGLELYGPNGARSESAGRVRVTRSFGDQGYPTDWRQFTGTGSWGFHFKTGAKTGSWGNGSTAGAFVLGSTMGSWFTANSGQSGVAVMLTNDNVRLVKFGRSLLEGATIADLTTEVYGGTTQGKWLAVRVDYVPGQEEEDEDSSDDGQYHAGVPAKMRLFVKEVAGPGGNPVAECGSGDLVQTVEVGDAVGGDLAYGGVVWNHGTAQLSETTGCTFDDICVPHMDGVGKAMEFRVIDEDVEGPEFYGFAMAVTAGTPTWLPFGGAIAAPEVNTSGMTVTGMVHDANGLTGNVSFTIKNGDDTVASGTATPAAVSGSTTEFTVSFTVAAGTIPSALRSADCHFTVTATDGDADRTESGTNVDTETGSADFPFTFADSTPKAPGWATVEGDGAEMAVLRWAHAGGTYVVVRGDAEIGAQATPAQGTTTEPLEGTTFAGLGKVVYKGTGDNHLSVANGWTAREFIVEAGSTNYFVVYGVTGNGTTGYYYSSPTRAAAYKWATTNEETKVVTSYTAVDGSGTPVASAVTEGAWPLLMPKYEPGEGVDAFAYRTSVCDPNDENPEIQALAFDYEYDSPRPQTGSGWGGAWGSGAGDTPDKWKVHDSSLLTGTTHYPAATGNKLYWKDTSTSSADEAKLTRSLANANGGDLFVAFIMNYQFGGDNKWVTLGLLDAEGHTLVSFGKQGGNNWNYAAISTIADSGSPFGDHRYQGYSPRELVPGHGNDYIVVGQLSRSDNKIRMWVFSGSDTIPELYKEETATETVTALECVQADCDFSSSLTVPAVAAIQLCAGSTGDANTELGHVYFDEIRFAGTWTELFLFNAPEVYTFDFDKPLDTTGIMVGKDEEGHRLWEVSDGALAHGNVGLNAQFGLHHRTGIQSASFTIQDDAGHTLLKNASNLAPETGGTAGRVDLSGTIGAAYSDWKTTGSGATGVAIPTNWISLESNYVVEVTLKSSGGREATVTAASESGGVAATDLFFGEYGEGKGRDKYVELYNASSERVDLRNYVLARGDNDQTDPNYSNRTWWCAAHVAPPSGAAVYIEPKSTIVLLDQPFNTDDSRARLAALQSALGTHPSLVMTNDVLDSAGSAPIVLMKAEVYAAADANGQNANSARNKPWLDACGDSQTKVSERFIMSRKAETSPLPRENLAVNLDEWDYRRWSFPKTGTGAIDDMNTTPAFTNFSKTAGAYDRNIGLGGNMEFRVFDDDTDAPALSGGGVKVGSGSRLTGEPGDRTYVMGAWSFTNYPAAAEIGEGGLTLEQYQWITEMWPYGMTTKGGVSWSPLLGGDDLEGYAKVIEAGTGKGQVDVEFDGIGQRKYGCMLAKASSSFDKGDEVWLGFDLDVSKLSDAVLTFGYAGGSAGFANARVEVSTTGQEGTFTHPKSWEFTANNTGGATTWTEWSGALADAGEAVGDAGHLWFRVVLKDYGTASGTFRMDNIRLEGAPQFLRVSDAQMNTETVVFDAVVSDEKSGLDAATAAFTCGVDSPGLTPSQTLNNGGKSESTFKWTKSGGFTKAKVQEWYEKSLEGKTQLRMTIADKDDDRPGDATTMTADYGTLDVYDDDDEPPTLEMATMKPRKDGTMAKWLLKEKTRTASETMDGLDVGDLGLDTTAGTTSNPRYSLATNDGVRAYAVYQSGWQAGSKYWTATVKNTTAGAGSITKVKFWSKVGSVLAPTGYRIESGTVEAGETEAESTASAGTGSLLTSGSAWVKEGAEGASGSPIKTWAEYSKDVSIPIAAGETLELRIFGTGADPDGIGATWYLWGLEFEGTLAVPGEGGEDGYTYVTDNSLTGGGSTTLTMSGYVWDESGLAAAPTYSLTNAATGTAIASGTVSFTSAGEPSTRTTKALGEFSQNITLSSMGYGVQLAEYKGGIHAADADYDREDSSGNNTDQSVLDGQFAFTVVDQDLVGPTAPTGVKVNGADVPNSAPNRDTVTWTNKPEFLVSFDVAHDIVPTETQLTSADDEYVTWREAHGITNGMVKKASAQKGATGVGEYRVALPGAGGAVPTAAAMSNAPAYSVAVTNGALANYGFERFEDAPGVPDGSWENPDGDSGINKGNNVGGSYPVAEGTNSYYLRSNGNGAVMRQVIPFGVSASDQTVTVGLKLKIFKRAAKGILYAKFEFSADGETWRQAGSDVALNTGDGASGDPMETWLAKEMSATALTANAGEKYLRFSLRMNGYTANIDDVRLSVRVGSAPAAGTADRATMRYVATTAGQGLDVKYLFAADADNDRPQDRRLGETATFYTAYDCTAPTPVGMNHNTGASTDDVDDPTTQMKLKWSTSGVGPDDNRPGEAEGSFLNPNYAAIPASIRSAAAVKTDVLSPWRTYKVYYSAYDPALVDEAVAAGAAASTPIPAEEVVTNYFFEKFLAPDAPGDGTQEAGKGRYTAWASVTADSVIEDSTHTTDYSGMGALNTSGVTVYDLENDLEYVFVTVGVDAAGNEGPATSASWATNNTIKFALTQGVVRARAAIEAALPSDAGETMLVNKFSGEGQGKGAALYWLAAGMHEDSDTHEMAGRVRKRYDLLYRDAGSFTEKGTEQWIREGTTQTNWNYQAGNFEELGRGKLRFYRASYLDRWQDAVTNGTAVKKQQPLASEDVYSMGRVRLVEGQNLVGLQGLPWTNTLRGVFGTDWPAADSASASTRVEFFGGNGASTESYWLLEQSGTRKWINETSNEDWTDHALSANFFARGFSITLPKPLPDAYKEFTATANGTEVAGMTWYPMMQVPTNGPVGAKRFSATVTYGGRENLRTPIPRFTLVNLNLPVAVNVADLGLVKTNADGTWAGGILPGNGTTVGDVIYTYDNEHKKVRDNTLMYYSLSEHKWKNSYGSGLTIYPNDAILIKSQGEASAGPAEGESWPELDETWTWTYSPTNFYQPPTRHMGRERTSE